MFFSSLLFSYLLCSALLDPTPPYSIRLYPTRCPTCLSLPFLSSMLWPLVSPIHWIFFCWQLTFQTWSPGWLLFKTSQFFFKTFSCSSIYEWNEGWIPNYTSCFHTCSLWNSVLLVKCAVKSSFVILAAKIFVKTVVCNCWKATCKHIQIVCVVFSCLVTQQSSRITASLFMVALFSLATLL